MTPPNTIHMFWIIPQYVFLSIAEVMFAISGLEFSFTQVQLMTRPWYYNDTHTHDVIFHKHTDTVPR